MDVVPGDVMEMNKHLVDYGFKKQKKKQKKKQAHTQSAQSSFSSLATARTVK